MERYINCQVHKLSEGNLLLGDEKTALFDCGMIFCAEETVEKVRSELKGRPLDYLFASHTHYDHIGALPYFRKAWPEVKLVTCEIGATVLKKDTPRRVIRELSIEAAENFYPAGIEACRNYEDDAFYADIIVKDNDEIPLGGVTVRVIETPGHTRDTLSYFIPELKLLIASESTGSLLFGNFYTFYLTGYDSAVSSIKKCGELPFEFISQAHTGVLPQSDTVGYFERAAETAREWRDFILSLRERGLPEDEMIDALADKYLDKSLLSIQPENAFRINAKAMIACTLRDF